MGGGWDFGIWGLGFFHSSSPNSIYKNFCYSICVVKIIWSAYKNVRLPCGKRNNSSSVVYPVKLNRLSPRLHHALRSLKFGSNAFNSLAHAGAMSSWY